MLYKLVLSLHLITVSISISFFLLRAYWSFTEDVRLRQRWVRILPHVNDTVLLTAGISLTFIIQQYPVAQPWLTAKIVALIIYILLGMMVLKGSHNLKHKTIYILLSISCFVYIIFVAITKSSTLLLF